MSTTRPGRLLAALVIPTLLSCGKGGVGAGDLDLARGRVEGLRGLTFERMPESVTITAAELPQVFARIVFPAKEQDKLAKASKLYALLGLLPPRHNLKASLERLLTQEALTCVSVDKSLRSAPDTERHTKAFWEKRLPTLRPLLPPQLK